jgi:hypothetical protein
VLDVVASPTSFNLVGSDLYFQAGGEIRHLTAAGALRDITVNALDVVGLRVQAPYAYFTRRSGAIARTLLDGNGAIEPLVGQLSAPWDLLISGDMIYFSSSSGPLGSVPTTGGTPTPLLAAAMTKDIEIDGDYIYVWAQDAQIGEELVTGICRVPLAGGTAEPLHPDLRASNFRIFGSDLYFTVEDDPKLYRSPGKTAAPVVAVDLTSWNARPDDLARDADFLYITTMSASEAFAARTPFPAGDPEVVFRYGTGLRSIQVDGDELVVAHHDPPGAILRSGKCPCD